MTRRHSLYHSRIVHQLQVDGFAGKYDPRHIEAYMRLEHSTLDGLDVAQFWREITIARQCINQGGVKAAEALALSYGLKPHALDVALYTTSPEENDNNWDCTTCGNRESFVGIDDHGYPGDDCDDDHCPVHSEENDTTGDICQSECSLTQPVTIDRDEDGVRVDYQSFEGGGDNAAIDAYDRVYCGCCHQLLWAGPQAWREDAPASDFSDATGVR